MKSRFNSEILTIAIDEEYTLVKKAVLEHDKLDSTENVFHSPHTLYACNLQIKQAKGLRRIC
jgi:hypothetical protein